MEKVSELAWERSSQKIVSTFQFYSRLYMSENVLKLYSDRGKILPQMRFEHTTSELKVQRVIPLCKRGMHIWKHFRKHVLKYAECNAYFAWLINAFYL